MADEVDTPAPTSDGQAAPTPAPVLTPKERRAQTRARQAAKRPAATAATPEERREQRAALRAANALARRRERAKARTKHQAGAHERSATPPRPHESGIQKTRQGVVVSDRAAKTITVQLDNVRPHRRYTKVVHTTSTVHAHDEHGEAHIGDTVVVRESRPLSRTKRWRLVEVVERAR